ncbi:hypothetical protein [Natrinema marinum]|nr:hypothetical protein [Natrinema marinum]
MIFLPGSTPTNFTEYDVTDDIDAHGEYFQPVVGCVPAVVKPF